MRRVFSYFSLFRSSVSVVLLCRSARTRVSSGKIRQEGTSHSQIMRTLHVLTDVYGPRLTGSPNLKAAGDWAIKQMDDVGLEERPSRAVGLRASGLGERAPLGAHRLAGQGSLVVEVLAWTPGTNGPRARRPCRSRCRQRPTQEELTTFSTGSRPSRARSCSSARRSVVPVTFNLPPLRREDADVREQLNRGAAGPAAASAAAAAAARSARARQPRPLHERSDRGAARPVPVGNGALVRINDAGREHGQIRAFNNRDLRRDEGGADGRDAQRGLRPHLAPARRRHAGRARVRHRQPHVSRRARPLQRRSPRFPAATRRRKS